MHKVPPSLARKKASQYLSLSDQILRIASVLTNDAHRRNDAQLCAMMSVLVQFSLVTIHGRPRSRESFYDIFTHGAKINGMPGKTCPFSDHSDSPIRDLLFIS